MSDADKNIMSPETHEAECVDCRRVFEERGIEADVSLCRGCFEKRIKPKL